GHHTHQAVGSECGGVVDSDCAIGSAPCLTPRWDENSRPMAIVIAEVMYQGICQECQRVRDLPTERD
ncbi:hypothetical protein ACFWPB_22200, partial [Rhodococcus sp. NPDC058514]